MKKYLLLAVTVMLGLASSPLYANHPGEGTRVDFLNKEGERIGSTILKEASYSYNLFYIGQDYNNGGALGMVYNGQTAASVNFVPWGEESYPMTVETAPDEDIKVTQEIISGGTTRTTEDLLCGSLIRFTIEVPEGEYPAVSILDEYTGVINGVPYWTTYKSLGLYGLLTKYPANNLMNMDYRATVLENLDSTGDFKRDESNPNVWYYDITMANEPMSLKFFTNKPDGALLNASCLRVLQNLYAQHSSVNFSPGNCGEPFIMSFVGDYLSEDLIAAQLTRGGIAAYDYTVANKIYTNVPWANNFLYIATANLLIDKLDSFDVSEKEKEIVRAQMMTLRSHAYWRILQCYGERWQDSDNGKALCAPLEATFNTENLPLSSMQEIADFCYSDLKYAIEIFSKYNYSRTEIIEPDLAVAQGVLMRIALLKEDWQTAASMAESILANVPLTTNDQLVNGFFTPEQSWIWGAWNNFDLPDYFTSAVYYWSTLTSDACNGSYCASWGMGTNAISKDLYDSTASGDIRRLLFVMPDHFTDEMANLSWWYDANNMETSKGIWVSRWYATPIYEYYSSNYPEGVDFTAFTNGLRQINIPFGGHTKFYQPGNLPYGGDAAISFMRSDEVLLTLAEAYYRMGNENRAKESLYKLNSMRIEGYSSDLTGQDLLKEIQLTRKIELWGEGHSWFDMKRWKLPLVKRAWVSGDTESGNWPSKMAGEVEPDANNGWKFAIPSLATSNNPLINGDVNSVEKATVNPQSSSLLKSTPDNKVIVEAEAEIQDEMKEIDVK